MTILRIAPRVPPLPGGQERHVLELTLEQSRAGHRVVLVYADGDPGQGEGWESHQIRPSRNGGRLAPERFRFGRALLGWLRRSRLSFDLVHGHGDYMEAEITALVARRAHCPAVLTCHAAWGAQPRWRALARRHAFSRLDHIFCVSNELARCIRSLGVETPITVQHSGTRLERLRAWPRQLSATPTIVAVGNLLPMKGYEVLLEAVRILNPTWPQLRVQVLGDGPLREELTAAAANLPQVIFRGSVDRDDVYQALRESWVYVLSSVTLPGSTEGLPTALIEALAAGLPTVATDVSGVRDVVNDSVNGLVVPEGDPTALASAIDRLLRDAELRDSLGDAAAASAEHFDWRHVAGIFTQVCQQLVDTPANH